VQLKDDSHCALVALYVNKKISKELSKGDSH